MKDRISQFFECECGGEGILVSVDKELDEVLFSLFTYGHVNEKPSFWSRLRYAFWHIKTGKKYADCVTMQGERAAEFSDLIKSYAVNHTTYGDLDSNK